MLKRLARACYRRRWAVLATWIVLLVGLFGLNSAFGGKFLDDFSLPGSESQEAAPTARRAPATSTRTATSPTARSTSGTATATSTPRPGTASSRWSTTPACRARPSSWAATRS